jgi:hypothetical protein
VVTEAAEAAEVLLAVALAAAGDRTGAAVTAPVAEADWAAD